MITITDVSNGGASGIIWECNADKFQIIIGGDFSGETVSVQRRAGNGGPWVTIDTISSDSMVTVENVSMLPYRLNTSAGGGTPSLDAVIVGPSARSIRLA